MSNRLVNLVHRVSGLKGPARAVLLVLADEARDHRGGRSTLTTGQISERTGFSKRTVHRAYVELAEAGHITREAAQPGAAVETLVHPGEALSAPAGVSAPAASLSAPACQSVRGSYREEEYNQSTIPEDRDAGGRAREPAALDQVDQLFDAWDAFLERGKLPGPITRSPARRAAIRSRLAEYGQGRLMMAIDQAERGFRAGKFRRPGQGDLWLNIDRVFEVRPHDAAMGLLAELLDGAHARPVAAKSEVVASAARVKIDRSGEGEAEREVRRLAKEAMGDHSYEAWLAASGLRIEGDTLFVQACSEFAADWIANQLGDHLRRSASKASGGQVRRIRASTQALTPA